MANLTFTGNESYTLSDAAVFAIPLNQAASDNYNNLTEGTVSKTVSQAPINVKNDIFNENIYGFHIQTDPTNVGIRFTPSKPCSVSGVEIYFPPVGYLGSGPQADIGLYDSIGNLLASVSSGFGSSTSGWVSINLSGIGGFPVSLSANNQYWLVVRLSDQFNGTGSYLQGTSPLTTYTKDIFTCDAFAYDVGASLALPTTTLSYNPGIDIISSYDYTTIPFSDSNVPTDAAATAIGIANNQSDSLTAFTDANLLDFGAKLTDTNALSERVGSGWGFAYTDSNILSDSVLRGIGAGLVDTNTLSDALNLSLIYLPSDTVLFSERVIAGWSLIVSDTNAASWNDAVAFNTGTDVFVIATDTQTLSDGVSQFGRGFQAITNEQLSISDNYNGYAAGIPVSQSDTVSLSDFVVSGNPSLVDYLSLNDSVAFSSTIPSRLALDSFIVSDSILVVVDNRLVQSDSIAISDLIAGTLPSIVYTDTLSFSETAAYTNASIFVDNPVLVSDAMQFFDSRQVSGLGINPKLGDSYSLLDNVYPLLASVQNNYLRNYLNDSI